MNDPLSSPPSFAVLLMTWILPKCVLDTILGDLFEEFSQRANEDERAANRWFWHQALHTSVIYFNKVFNSPKFVRKINLILPILLFVVAFLLIAWLSYADNLKGYSEGFWQILLSGNAHMALFEKAFWLNLADHLLAIDGGKFLVDIPSFIITTVCLLLLVFLDKRQNFSPLKMACWGYSLVLLPYVWSLIHISSNHYQATQIGPITAIGLISFFYMILPISYLVHRKLKSHQVDSYKEDNQSQSEESNNES